MKSRPSSIHAFVFAGAVLLFALEPLVGRLLLPRFGGGFHVWTTALMFYQGALFLAYLYAHLAGPRLGAAHLLVIAAPLLFLPPSVGAGDLGGSGFGAILWLLLRHVAVPFSVLATTAVVAQRWWTKLRRDPWSLYAVSNAGSLGALLSYALFIEPLVGLEVQRWAWSVGYLIYVGLAMVAWRSVRAATPGSDERSVPSEETAGVGDTGAGDAARRPTEVEAPREATPTSLIVYWTLLSAAPSALLMAVTNMIALDVGSVPLVWVVPLSVYLGSFVIAFADPDPATGDESRVPRTVRRLWPHVSIVGLFFFSGGGSEGGWISFGVHLAVLGFITLAAHGELYRVRPTSAHLTRYYLVIAGGGWLGGALVALAAPAVFSSLLEYPISVVAIALTMAVGRRRALRRWLSAAPKPAIVLTACLLAVTGWRIGEGSLQPSEQTVIESRRSFYGLYRVTRRHRDDAIVTDLVSGTTRHGRQREGDLSPLSYYHRRGPLGDSLSLFPDRRRIGVVGLGVGAAAGHLREGDELVFFEIDPVVVELARTHFSFLSDSPGSVAVEVGDARLSLNRERRPFDLLFIDAFAGDAIPTHLLTVEALELYLRRITDDGVVLFHISNRYYDLLPALTAAARELGLSGASVFRGRGLARDQDPTQCLALARRPDRIRQLIESGGWSPLAEATTSAPAWTDNHANLLSALRWTADF